MVKTEKVNRTNYKMCWYTGPSTALIVKSPTKKVANYGYYTGISRHTGKPTNTFFVHNEDIKVAPSLFKIMTEDEARLKYPHLIESLVANKQVLVTSSLPEKTENVNDETVKKRGRPRKV